MAYKHDYDKALTRLRVILQRLNDGEALGVKELADEFNVSTRTIQRDFNEKLVASYPIFQENKKWKMQDGFKIEKIRDIDDKIILDIIEKITDGIGGTFAIKSKKLLSKIKNSEHNPIYAKLNIEDVSDKLDVINTLENAIKSKLEISCKYIYDTNKRYETTLCPLKIVNFEGFWYLIAMKKGEIKKYYLKELSHVKLCETTFETNTKIDKLLDNSISIWFNQHNEPFSIKLYATKSASKYFKRRPLPTQTITSDDDNTLEFEIKITHEMEILPIIKYWIPHLYVLEPIWLKDMIKEDLKDYMDNLEKL